MGQRCRCGHKMPDHARNLLVRRVAAKIPCHCRKAFFKRLHPVVLSDNPRTMRISFLCYGFDTTKGEVQEEQAGL